MQETTFKQLTDTIQQARNEGKQFMVRVVYLNDRHIFDTFSLSHMHNEMLFNAKNLFLKVDVLSDTFIFDSETFRIQANVLKEIYDADKCISSVENVSMDLTFFEINTISL